MTGEEHQLFISIDNLTPELKDELDAQGDLDVVFLLDDEDIQELNFNKELDDIEL